MNSETPMKRSHVAPDPRQVSPYLRLPLRTLDQVLCERATDSPEAKPESDSDAADQQQARRCR